ncbi:ATP-dependent DNA helicase RecQ [Ephemerocybe angulata]|uniref:DNA 3'-5' helicase n=1 Tax=Ephemerocybe angulata TaxID=980116 RepID=A0A8H6HG19_9AGAR|nr:ATP-dependent DNA helicase RecQ [Tulosesus angulatus]
MFTWTSNAGKTTITEILRAVIPQWPTGPHEFQVDACANLLDKKPTVLLASTASGKTATFFCPLLVLQHLLKHPRPEIPSESIPAKPVVLVVTPLVELGNNHAKEMAAFNNMKAISINAETIESARQEGRNLYAEVRACEWSMVFLSAERLTSKDVAVILKDPTFRANVVMLGIDEGHVLIPWSLSFRAAYKQISQLRRRLPDHCTLAVVTATLTAGGLKALCDELDLREGGYKVIRRSVQRANVRTVVRELSRGIGSLSFPDIAWIFKNNIKAVVFCATLDLVWRVGVYGWEHFPLAEQLDRVRLWSSITSPSYNKKTLELFADDSRPTTIVATIAFSMGMNLPNITYSINLGLPETLEALVQQNGRAGRDHSTTAVGITYVPPTTIASFQHEINTLADEDSDPAAVHRKLAQFTKTKVGTKPATSGKIDPNLRSLILAHLLGVCLEGVKNEVLSCPSIDPPGTCSGALNRRVLCSSCGEETGIPAETVELPTTAPISSTPSAPNVALPVPTTTTTKATKPPPTPTSLPAKLSRKIVANLKLWLADFALKQWNAKPSAESLFSTKAAMDEALKDWKYLGEDGQALFELLTKLIAEYVQRIEAANEVKKKRAAATRLRAKGVYLPTL